MFKKSRKQLDEDTLIIDATGNTPLANVICDNLSMKPTNICVDKLDNGEFDINILESVRGKDVFVIHSLSNPISENLMKLLLLIDALKRASVGEVTLVCPYLGYNNHKDKKRGPISAKVIADVISNDIDRIITVELGNYHIKGFYDIPVDNVSCKMLFREQIKKNGHTISNSMIYNFGNNKELCESYSKYSGIKINKNICDIKSCDCIFMMNELVVDNNFLKEVKRLKEVGANCIIIFATHFVASCENVNLLENSEVDKIYICDTIDNNNVFSKEKLTKFNIIPTFDLLSEAIYRIDSEYSIMELLK